jgi:hypothetical protein
MTAADRFSAAAQAADVEGILATFAPDMVLHNPITKDALQGREATRRTFIALVNIFEDFTYLHHFSTGTKHVLIFSTRIGDESVQGVDLLELDDQDQIATFTVFLRPISGLTALAKAMGARMGAPPPQTT